MSIVKKDKARKTEGRIKDAVRSGQGVGFGNLDADPSAGFDESANNGPDRMPVQWMKGDRRDDKMADLVQLEANGRLGPGTVLGERGMFYVCC